MENIKEKRKAGIITLSHKLSKSEHINLIELDIVQRGEIPMLCTVQAVSGVGGTKLLFQLPEYTSLNGYLARGVDFGSFCEIVGSLVKTVQNCDAHGIRSSNLELESRYIFVDEENRRLHLLYWPLTTLSEPRDLRGAFFELGRLYKANEKDGEFIDQYFELFNNRMKFNIGQFEAQLRALHESWKALNRPKRRQPGTLPAVFDKRSGQRIVLRKFPFIFGRISEFCDYSYPADLMMSRCHFTLIERDSGIYIMDNNSTNGTIVNGSYIPSADSAEGPLLLHDGDVIQAGGETLICRFG